MSKFTRDDEPEEPPFSEDEDFGPEEPDGVFIYFPSILFLNTTFVLHSTEPQSPSDDEGCFLFV